METFGFGKTMNKKMKSGTLSILWILAAFLAMALAPSSAIAQRESDVVTVSLNDPPRPAYVRASVLNGGITVKASDGNRVIVEARVRGGDSSDRTKGGMRRIPVSTTGLSVEVDEETNQVRIGTDSTQRTVDLTITVPRQTSLRLRAVNDGDIRVTGVEGELDVNNTNGEVILTNVAGSAIAHALNGQVLVSFTRVNPKPMAFSSLNGNIDVTFPADLKASLSLRSDNGEVYSDFDVQLQAAPSQPMVEDSGKKGGKYRVKIDKAIRGTINGGGPEIQFTNFNGDIYIRKAGSAR